MTCRKCEHGTAKKFGYFGKRRIQRWRCTSCKSTFCDPQPASPLGTMRTELDAAIRAIQCLLEGCSIRSTERMTGINRNTIMRLLVLAGERSARLMDERMKKVSCRYLQCDEIWTYVSKKARNVKKDDPSEFGGAWIFVALDEETKLIPCYFVGKRTMFNTQTFIWDLWKRMANRVQITTDAYPFYTKAVTECFGTDADFAQLKKLFGDYGQHDSASRYSPGPIMEVISKVVQGNPDPKHISTSMVGRQNLTLRMQIRRLTRLTNAFSRKLENLKAAIALHFAYYNFCRVHSSLRVTPAMEAGLTDHIWSVAELLRAA
jgi:transposase-like protein/IS1 family transposase